MTNNQLVNYINKFKDHQREEIYKKIVDSQLLQKAFETTEGKQILSGAIELITTNILQIVSGCCESVPGESNVKIYQCATEINTAYKLISDWARIIAHGEDHIKNAEKEMDKNG